jgi:hypothetical protein
MLFFKNKAADRCFTHAAVAAFLAISQVLTTKPSRSSELASLFFSTIAGTGLAFGLFGRSLQQRREAELADSNLFTDLSKPLPGIPEQTTKIQTSNLG